jgi:hypothetical protein
MKISLIFSLLASIVSSTNLYRFNKWVETYLVDVSNEFKFNHVFNNWIVNDQIIRDTNAKNLSYTLAHNKFSGYSQQEFRLILNLNYQLR